MQGKTKTVIQGVLLVAFVFAAIRLYVIFSGRGLEGPQKPGARQVDTGLNPDGYVVPKKLYASDLKSAQALAGKPAWIKEGYRYTVYPFDNAAKRADFSRDAGTLGPIERIEIREVREQPTPGRPGQKQVLAIFEKEGKSYALPIGTARGGQYTIYADEALFYEDPHELYRHWPADIWQAVERHEIKPGMNEIQASFAVGMGKPFRSDDPDVKTVEYPNGGRKLTVTYRRGRAAQIDAGS